MNLPEKDKFVNDTIDSLKRNILKKIDTMPEAWDGHELRQFILDYYQRRYIFKSTLLTGKRKKEYKNTCIVKNFT